MWRNSLVSQVVEYANFFLKLTKKLCNNHKSPLPRDEVRRKLFDLSLTSIEDLLFAGSAAGSMFDSIVLTYLRRFMKLEKISFWSSPAPASRVKTSLKDVSTNHKELKYQTYRELIGAIDQILDAACQVTPDCHFCCPLYRCR